MLAAAAGCSSKSGETVPPAPTELLGHHPLHAAHVHRRRGILELGQRRPVRRGDLFGEGGLEYRQRLPELHGATLELAQYGEELFGGALLQIGIHQLRGATAEAAPQPDGGPGPAIPSGKEASRAVLATPFCGMSLICSSLSLRAQEGLPAARLRSSSRSGAAAMRVDRPGPPAPTPVRERELDRAVDRGRGLAVEELQRLHRRHGRGEYAHRHLTRALSGAPRSSVARTEPARLDPGRDAAVRHSAGSSTDPGPPMDRPRPWNPTPLSPDGPDRHGRDRPRRAGVRASRYSVRRDRSVDR